MEDNKVIWIIALLFGVWLISGSPDLSNLFILTGEEGYIIIDDFSDGSLDPSQIVVTGSVSRPLYSGEPIKQNTDPRGNYQVITSGPPRLAIHIPLPFNSFDNPYGQVNFIKDYKGQNFRLDIAGSSTSGTFNIIDENGLADTSCSVIVNANTYTRIEVISGDLNPDEIIVRSNGQTICNKIHLGALKIIINGINGGTTSSIGSFEIIAPRFQPKILGACTLDSNDLLAAETFVAGQTIDYYSTRFPTKSYC